MYLFMYLVCVKYSYFNSYYLNICIICVEIDLSNLVFGIFLIYNWCEYFDLFIVLK